MAALDTFLDTYFSMLMPVMIVVAILQMLFYHLRGVRIEKGYNEKSSSNVLFRESFASGRRRQPFSFGGSSAALKVVVTDREIVIKGIWPVFTAMGRHFCLTHRVPLSNVESIRAEGNRAELRFLDESGKDTLLYLQLKKAAAFRQAASLSPN